MTDRKPQDYAGGDPDGVTDNTAAIQAAIDAWQPGDQVVISGGTFRTTSGLSIAAEGLRLVGDGEIRAKTTFAGDRLLTVAAEGVVLDADGLELDQADIIVGGVSLYAEAAVGLQVLGLVSRGTQRACVELGDGTTDVLVEALEHLGHGYGVLVDDALGVARLTVRDSVLEHVGSGPGGDGIELTCPTHGASEVLVEDTIARSQIGEALNQGIGFGFSGVSQGRLVRCRAEGCEGDGFHVEGGSAWSVEDCAALEIGIAEPVGGNGSGLIAYDSDEVAVLRMTAIGCSYHGIALSGQNSPSQRTGGRIERCRVETTGRDGIHLTAQEGFRVERNWVRDPSDGHPGVYAGIHVGQQGSTSLENVDGGGGGNVIVLSGATSALGALVVRPQSVAVAIGLAALLVDRAVTRLMTHAQGLRTVGSTADLASIVEGAQRHALPAAYVHLAAEAAGANRLQTVGVSQRLARQLGVLLVVAAQGQARATDVPDVLEPLLLAARAALVGWQPDDGHEPCLMVRGEMVRVAEGTAWWLDLHQTATELRG